MRSRRARLQALALGLVPLIAIFLLAEFALRLSATHHFVAAPESEPKAAAAAAALALGESPSSAPHSLKAEPFAPADSQAEGHSAADEDPDSGVDLMSGDSSRRRSPLRILWVGASHVYGVGAPAHKSVADQMEVRLRAIWDGPVKVDKLAQIGMGSTGLVQLLRSSLPQAEPNFIFFWGGDANSLDYHGRRRWLARRSLARQIIDYFSEWSRLVKFTDMLFRYDEHEYSSSSVHGEISELSRHPLTSKWTWMGNLMPWEPFARDLQPSTVEWVRSEIRRGQLEFPYHLGFVVAEANLTSQTSDATFPKLIEEIDRAFLRARELSRRPLLVELLIEKVLERDSRNEGLRLTPADREQLQRRLNARARDAIDTRLAPWLKKFFAASYAMPSQGLSRQERETLEMLLEWMPELFGSGFLLAQDALGRAPQDAAYAWRVYEQNFMANPYPPMNAHATLLPALIGLVAEENTQHTRDLASRINERFPGLFDLLASDLEEKRAWLKSDLSEAKAWVEYHNQRRPLAPRAQLIIVGFQPNRLNGQPTAIHALLKGIANELELPFLDTYQVIHDAARATNEPIEAFFTQLYGPRDHHLNERGYAALAVASLELPALRVQIGTRQSEKSQK